MPFPFTGTGTCFIPLYSFCTSDLLSPFIHSFKKEEEENKQIIMFFVEVLIRRQHQQTSPPSVNSFAATYPQINHTLESSLESGGILSSNCCFVFVFLFFVFCFLFLVSCFLFLFFIFVFVLFLVAEEERLILTRYTTVLNQPQDGRMVTELVQAQYPASLLCLFFVFYFILLICYNVFDYSPFNLYPVSCDINKICCSPISQQSRE